MKIIIRVIIVLLFCTGCAAICIGQNLIRNNSFEGGQSGFPNEVVQMERSNHWKDGTVEEECPADLDGDGIIDGSTTVFYHSPDWLKANPSNLHLEFNNQGDWELLTPPDGEGFALLGVSEVVSQNLEEALEVGKVYKVRLKVNLPDRWKYIPAPGSSGLTPTGENSNDYPTGLTEFPLDILLAKNEIDYPNGGGCSNNICTQEYFEKNNENEILIAETIMIPSSMWGTGWHEVETIFKVNESGFDWFGLEHQVCQTEVMILVDDIELMEVPCSDCELCDSATDGCIVPIFKNITAGLSSPFTICNLENVQDLKIEIVTSVAQTNIRNIEITSPNPSVAWDGRDNNGNPVAAAFYIVKLTLENDCDHFTENIRVFQAEQATFVPGLMDHVSVPKLDLDDGCCAGNECVELNNITLDPNPADPSAPPHTIVWPDPDENLTIRALSKVSIGPNIVFPDNFNLTVIAGEEIEILHGAVLMDLTVSGDSVIDLIVSDDACN